MSNCDYDYINDGYISDDGIYSVLEYDDLDMMCDDVQFNEIFSQSDSSKEVNHLSKRLNMINLMDSDKSKDQLFQSTEDPINSCSPASFASKQRLQSNFEKRLNDQLQDAFCLIFNNNCMQLFDQNYSTTDDLMLDVVKLFDESTRLSNSELSDDDKTSMVSSGCEDTIQFLDVDEDSQDLYSEDVLPSSDSHDPADNDNFDQPFSN
ncbi:hypothetical protein ACP70R_040149 [Stipagrostis hirtigluma subsp. patula]